MPEQPPEPEGAIPTGLICLGVVAFIILMIYIAGEKGSPGHSPTPAPVLTL